MYSMLSNEVTVDFLPSLNRGDSYSQTVKPDRKSQSWLPPASHTLRLRFSYKYKTFFTAMQKLEEMGELSELMPVYTHGIEVFTPKRAGKTIYGQLEVDLNTAVNSDTNAISFFVLACRL